MRERKAGMIIRLLLSAIKKDCIVIGGVARYATEPSYYSLNLRLHEQAHILQQEREGVLFYPKYLLELITKGYDEVSYELEADSYARIKESEKSLYASLYIMDDNEYIRHCYVANG